MAYSAEDLESILLSEAALDALAAELDVSLEGRPGPCATVIAIGQQAWQVYRGLRREAEADPLGITATILLRSLANAAILLRWIEDAPALRVQMYYAEEDRLNLETLARTRTFDRWKAAAGEPGERDAAIRASINGVRREAHAAGEPVNADAGSVLPPIEVMAARTGDRAAAEAYAAIFRTASSWTHFGASALDRHGLVSQGGELRVELRPAAIAGVGLRHLAGPSAAHLLGSVSRTCGLGIEREARWIQEFLTLWIHVDDGPDAKS